jgi:hypothetical protein
VEALDVMLRNVDLPFEAAPAVALAYQTAKRVDAHSSLLEGFSPLANSMLKQIEGLRQWIQPPDPTNEDPFDALAKALAGEVATGGDGE